MQKHRIISLLLCICLTPGFHVVIPPSPVYALSSEEIRDEIDELEKEEQELKEQIDALEQKRTENIKQIEQIVEQKRILDQQITLQNQQILNIRDQIRILRMKTADKQEQYDLAVSDYESLNAKYLNRIRTMEEQGPLSYWSILFRAHSFSDFLDRINMIEEIAAADRMRLQQLHDSAAQVKAAQDQLQVQQQELQSAVDALEMLNTQLAEKREASDQLLRNLAEQDTEFERLLDASEEAQQALLLEIAKKETEFDWAAYEEWIASQKPAVPPSTPQTPTTPGTDIDWIVPVPYYTLTSPFGMRWHPVYGDYRMHNGIDMACAENTPIYASRGGQVTIAQYSNTAGNYVQINHGDGYRSVYMHMTYYTVSAGAYVTAGQIIGYVGNTGVSKGNHLHFGISYNGEYINPYPLIAGK